MDPSLAMSRRDDDGAKGREGHGDDGGGGFEREDGGVGSGLDQISWLPSVKSGRQPYRPSFRQISRKKSVGGDGYDRLEDGGGASAGAPPGYRNIDILPVLPVAMVDGLEGMAMEEETLDGVGYHDGIDGYFGPAAAGVRGPDPSSVAVTLSPGFSGTASYLPHTKGHVLTADEPRHKKMYDDLMRVANYHAMKRDGAVRRAKEAGDGGADASSLAAPVVSPSLPGPDEKRRFIVTAANPVEDGVFAEYGLLFQVTDLDEVAEVTLEEMQDVVESLDARGAEGEDIMDVLVETKYEATHDVVGRVRIHRFVNPECHAGGPEGEEYLMAEATVLDVEERDRLRIPAGERALRQSFSKLVSLQHELKEDIRLTRTSGQTLGKMFGMGPAGVWLSAAGWSHFVKRRLEAELSGMHRDLRKKLAARLASRGVDGVGGNAEGSNTIDLEDLGPELRRELRLVWAKAAEDLGPAALELAVRTQRIIQAEGQAERLGLLKDCVDIERRRLEAKRSLRSLASDENDGRGDGTFDFRAVSRKDARLIFERLMSSDRGKDDLSGDASEGAFQ